MENEGNQVGIPRMSLIIEVSEGVLIIKESHTNMRTGGWTDSMCVNALQEKRAIPLGSHDDLLKLPLDRKA